MSADLNTVLQNYTGITDVLKQDLLVEYAAGRITGDTYAQVYSQLMSVSLQQASAIVAQLANVDLIEQKVLTEKAQIQDTLDELKSSTNATGTVQGSIGKQKEVYQTQITAFRDKALQDFMNNLLNTWSVRRTTDPDERATTENLLTDMDIGKTIKHVADNLGVPLPSPAVPPPTPDSK